MSTPKAKEFLKSKINIPESDSPTWIPFEECVECMKAHTAQRLSELKEKVEELSDSNIGVVNGMDR